MEVKVEPIYSEKDDMTFIMRNTYEDGCLSSKELLGWYHGEPNENNDREYVGKFKAEYEITTNTTSLYYATINIVDYLALYEDVIPKIKKSKLYRILFELQSITGDTVEDIADANDAGGCKTWSELVDRFKELHKKGERI